MTDIPRKLSVDALSDPELAHWVTRIFVWLDGVRQDKCISYDMDEGVIERYLEIDGRLATDGHELVVETVRGKVEVTLRDA